MTRTELAMLIFGGGGIQFGEFTLKMHEKYPEAPKSPIYINLRTPPKGPLKPEIIWAMGQYDTLGLLASGLEYNYVVGLPKAGEPIAKAFSQTRVPKVDILTLEKREDESSRQILPVIHGSYQEGQTVLMIDDLITAADTKLEGARALRANGLVVKDCLVVVDRQQGGKEQLLREGIALHALLTLQELLELYELNGLIDTQTRQRVINYQKEVDEYLATQASGA